MVYNPMKIGGIPTANATMIPMREPWSRLFHPLEFEFAVDAPGVPPVLVVELLMEGAAMVAVDPPVIDVAALATGPTAIVVVDVGRLGSVSSVLASQVSITAAIAPLNVA
jgi:hypothetical protein